MVTYDVKFREVSSPMDAYIMVVEAGDEELHLERKEKREEKEGQKENTQEATRPNPTFLQQQVQIHKDNMVSTFGMGNKMM